MFYPWPDEGYAWHVGTEPDGRRIIRKGGGMPQYATQIVDYPDDRLVFVWATNNLQQRWRQALNRGIAGVAFGTEAVVPPARVAGDVRGFAGRYVTSNGKIFEIAANDDFLYALENDASVPADGPFFLTGANELTGFNPTLLTLTRMTLEGNTIRVGEVVAARR